jgi:hypothetical protein
MLVSEMLCPGFRLCGYPLSFLGQLFPRSLESYRGLVVARDCNARYGNIAREFCWPQILQRRNIWL